MLFKRASGVGMTIILSLGLPKDFSRALTTCLSATVHEADCFEKAFAFIEEVEVNTIICDSRAFPVDIKSIERLLGCTPPTTQIVLMLATDDHHPQRELLDSLGVKTMMAPIAAQELAQALSG